MGSSRVKIRSERYKKQRARPVDQVHTFLSSRPGVRAMRIMRVAMCPLWRYRQSKPPLELLQFLAVELFGKDRHDEHAGLEDR
ncbi:MAG: hypothetical protein H6Q32_1104 [Bacteroidetes bacterium]|nr:hypothetical protein [Bacteroidota bacterium]